MPPGRPPSSVKAVCLAYRLRGTDADTVAAAYDVISAGSAPLIVAAAARMLPDLKADAAAGHQIVFLGRDGHALAAAVRGLDRAFFDSRCCEVVLSRALAELAVQDLETNAGEQFPQLAGYRQARGKVAARHIPGAFRALTAYLHRSAVPVGIPGGAVTIVDNGMKGTIQELLAACFPRTVFRGRYLVYLASPDDPHPGSKQGYLIHRTGPGWTGLPLPALPADPALTFACRDGVKAIEDTLNGTKTSPAAWTGSRPRQRPQQQIRRQLAGLNPALVDPAYIRPQVREAVKAAALLAVYDTAAAARRARAAGPGDWQAPLDAASARFTSDVRAWIGRRPVSDPRLSGLLDSFVRRADQDINRRLARAFRRGRISPDDAMPVWQTLGGMRSLHRKQRYAATVEAAIAHGRLNFSVAPVMTHVSPLPAQPRRRATAPRLPGSARPRPYR